MREVGHKKKSTLLSFHALQMTSPDLLFFPPHSVICGLDSNKVIFEAQHAVVHAARSSNVWYKSNQTCAST